MQDSEGKKSSCWIVSPEAKSTPKNKNKITKNNNKKNKYFVMSQKHKACDWVHEDCDFENFDPFASLTAHKNNQKSPNESFEKENDCVLKTDSQSVKKEFEEDSNLLGVVTQRMKADQHGPDAFDRNEACLAKYNNNNYESFNEEIHSDVNYSGGFCFENVYYKQPSLLPSPNLPLIDPTPSKRLYHSHDAYPPEPTPLQDLQTTSCFYGSSTANNNMEYERLRSKNIDPIVTANPDRLNGGVLNEPLESEGEKMGGRDFTYTQQLSKVVDYTTKSKEFSNQDNLTCLSTVHRHFENEYDLSRNMYKF